LGHMLSLALLLVSCTGEKPPEKPVEVEACMELQRYADADGDGFGDPATGVLVCAGETDDVEDATDCDDTNALVHPGAAEACTDADGATDWYRGGDEDGWGDAGDMRKGREAEAGYVPDRGDCDDTNRMIRPDAYELCNYIDDDCDGDVDENSALDATNYFADL